MSDHRAPSPTERPASARSRPGRSVAAFAVAVALFAAPALAEKTDVVHLKNGDRITCEIKGLEHGQLKISTDAMGTVYVKWEDLAALESKETFQVELDDGTRVNGSLAPQAPRGMLLVQAEDGQRGVQMDDITRMDALKLSASQLSRWDGSLSAGYDFTKAASTSSLNASFDTRYRADDYLLKFTGSMSSRSQANAPDTLRASVDGAYRRFLQNRWYWALFSEFERNDELGVELRIAGGAGLGRYVFQSGRAEWSLTGGLAGVGEKRIGEESQADLQGVAGTEYQYYVHYLPKTNVLVRLNVFQSLVAGTGLRANLDLSLRRELIEDFFLDLTFYDSYSSRPPEEAASKNDYGIVTGIGYSF